jgi:hypothetical protein
MRKCTAPVNGLEMYYEIHGEGRPLIMLHGGVVATESLGPNPAQLAKSRGVIVLDGRRQARCGPRWLS